MRAALILMALVLVTACGRTHGDVKPAAPGTSVKVIPVPQKVYVKIDDELVALLPWKYPCKKVSEGTACAKERGIVLREYERQIKAIKKIRGTAVPE